MNSDVTAAHAWATQSFTGDLPATKGRVTVTVLHEDMPGDTHIRQSAASTPLRLGEQTYPNGIGVNASTVLHVDLGGQAADVLRADIGVDRGMDGTEASVHFRVHAAGTELYRSPLMRPGEKHTLEIPLAGVTAFDLIVDNGGDTRSCDQADWADARVILSTGKTVQLDDVMHAATPRIPFTFDYNGRPSSEFLHLWKRASTDETLDVTRTRRTVSYTDPATGLQVQAVLMLYADSPAIDWTLYFTNTGAQDTPILENVQAVDTEFRMPKDGTATLHRLHGGPCSAEDWLPFDQDLPFGGQIDMAAVNGHSSSVSPFFTLDWGAGGVITAIGWTGQWQATIGRGYDGARLQASMPGLHTVLHPGETIRTPRIMLLPWSRGDQYDAYNAFRRTMLAHNWPRVDGKPVMPPITHMSTSFYEMNDSTEANTLSHLDAIKGLGFEQFWLDAYWTKDGFPNGMGNYGFPLDVAEPKDRFPHGLKPIGDAAHAAGLQFLVWFEPERVASHTLIAREHPEWVLHATDQDSSGLFDLGAPAARQYMTDYLKAVVKGYGLDWLRFDYNFDPLPYWQHADAQSPARAGISQIRYVEGLYRMWDDLRAAYPHLSIDNCAGGGRRIDLETCARSLVLWRTDATIEPLFAKNFHQAALQNQVMTAGLNCYVPMSVTGQMGSTPYDFYSGFNGGISFGEDVRPADYPREQLRRAIAEAKALRPYFLGDFYPLTPVTLRADDWCAYQFHRPETHNGLVMAFRRPDAPAAKQVLNLRAIDPQAHYTVKFHADYRVQSTLTMMGADLAHLIIDIPEQPGCRLVEYRQTNEIR